MTPGQFLASDWVSLWCGLRRIDEALEALTATLNRFELTEE